MLTKRQRNALYTTIANAGLDPRQCELGDVVHLGGDQTIILHRPSDSHFLVTYDKATNWYTTGGKAGDEILEGVSTPEWAAVTRSAGDWTRLVREFTDSPDLWAELRREQEILSGAEYARMSNAPFTAGEQLRIAEQLREVKSNLVEQYSLSGERLSRVEAKLDEVVEASHRLGRKDWLNIFLGVMLTVIVTAILPPDAVQHIIANVIHGLPDLFGFGGPPPSIPPVA
jgi:hypothetical protein